MLPFRLTVATAHYRMPIFYTQWIPNFRLFDRYDSCCSLLASHLLLRRRDQADWTRALGQGI
jgi:hypothetical protein